MNRYTQRHTRITPLNPPEPAGQRKRRELAGEHLVEDQAAYLDRSEVDTAEPLTDTAIYEGELPTGAGAEPIDTADLPDSQNLELLADIADGAQPLSIAAELLEIEILELLADIYEAQLPVRLEEGLVSELAGLDLLTDAEVAKLATLMRSWPRGGGCRIMRAASAAWSRLTNCHPAPMCIHSFPQRATASSKHRTGRRSTSTAIASFAARSIA
jgi:hypothetical protein